MLDLDPATRLLNATVAGVPDDRLHGPTPCAEFSVATLLDHVAGFCLALRAAALKEPLEGGAPQPDAARLAPDWRDAIPVASEAMGAAWKDSAAWEGTCQLGGFELPGEVVGQIALGELLVHGWDLAMSTGQPFDYDGPHVDEVVAMVHQFQAMGIEGPFAEAIVPPDGAPAFVQLLCASGRDPGWRP
jgi:uncharacterized protein (TIGR03086 family)